MTSLPPPLRATLIRDLAPLSLRHPQCHRPVRPSLFRQQQRRLQTIPQPPPPSPQPAFPQYASHPPPPLAKPPRRWGRAMIYSALFFIAGSQLATWGIARMGLLAPIHEPGSAEDEAAIAALEREIESLDIVKQFRGSNGIAVEGQPPPFIEILPRPTHRNGGENVAPAPSLDSPHNTTLAATTALSSTLHGSRGLGMQKTYYNPTSGDLYAIVYFGPALAGWPSITHGGAIATVMEESMARCAGLVRWSGGQAVVRVGLEEGGIAVEFREAEDVGFRYFRPTVAKRVYVLHAVPLERDWGILETDSKSEADGRIEVIKDKAARLTTDIASDKGNPATQTGWSKWVMGDGRVKMTATLMDAKSQKTMCTATGTWGPA